MPEGTLMSKEQLTERQADVGVTERDVAAPDQTHGLPPHVYAQVMRLGPADAPALADLLNLYASLSVRILTVAAPHVGNSAVQRAITIAQNQSKAQGAPGALSQGEMHEMLDDAPAKAQGKPGALSQAEMHEMLDDAPARTQGKPGALSQAEMHEMLDDAPAKTQGKPGALSQAEMHEMLDDAPAKAQGRPGALSQAEMHEMLDDAPAKAQGRPGALSQAEMHEVLDDKPAQGRPGALSQAEMHEVLDDKPAAAAPAWVAGARKYNALHAEFVSDFNDATASSCVDASGQLDPEAVARWQRQHGLDADGKVGSHTLAAARQASAKAVPAATVAEPRIPV
jgi:hypothetical protein